MGTQVQSNLPKHQYDYAQNYPQIILSYTPNTGQQLPSSNLLQKSRVLSAELPNYEQIAKSVKTLSIKDRYQSPQIKGNHSTYLIDSYFKCEIPKDDYHKEAIQYWTDQSTFYQRLSWLAEVVTVLGGAGAVSALITHSSSRLALTALAVFTITSFIFTGLSIRWTNQAVHQKKEWENLTIEAVAKKRTEAYKGGFLYVYENNLKCYIEDEKSKLPNHYGVLHSTEVRFLFEQYYCDFCKAFLDNAKNCTSPQQQQDWLNQFQQSNPLSKKLLKYALSDIGKYADIIRDYELLVDILNNRIRKDDEEGADNIAKNIDAQKKIALIPFDRLLKHYKDTLSNATLGNKQSADSETLNQYIEFYKFAIIPLNTFFDERLKEAPQKLKEILEKFKAKNSQTIENLFEHARTLITRALELFQDLQQAQQNRQNSTYKYQLVNILDIKPPNFLELAYNSSKPEKWSNQKYQEYLNYIKPIVPQ